MTPLKGYQPESWEDCAPLMPNPRHKMRQGKPLNNGQSSLPQRAVRSWRCKCLLFGIALECSLLRSEGLLMSGNEGCRGRFWFWRGTRHGDLCERMKQGWWASMWNTDMVTSCFLRTLIAACAPTPQPHPHLAYREAPGVEDQIGFCLQLLDAGFILSSCGQCDSFTPDAEAGANYAYYFSLLYKFSPVIYLSRFLLFTVTIGRLYCTQKNPLFTVYRMLSDTVLPCSGVILGVYSLS